MQDNLHHEGKGHAQSPNAAGDWLTRMEDLGEDRGYFEPLGPDHSAILTDAGETLVVTFETETDIRKNRADQTPFGWQVVEKNGWSNLCVIAHGTSWFRDRFVYGFFDRLTDDGFFEEFDRVVFYGAGMCAYAAAAFSVVAPDVEVIAIQPQATLEPTLTQWDLRFPMMRRTSFSDRYGYAPDMVEMAKNVYVFYPRESPEDVMHAAMFQGDNVHHVPVRWMGSSLHKPLLDMKVPQKLVELAGLGKLDEQRCFQILRSRRNNLSYLKGLVTRLEKSGRSTFVKAASSNVMSRLNTSAFFDKSLARAEQKLAAPST